MAGFVAEEELAAHFMMADIYVMPSSKEGFGLVFIEAMFYGLPVIAGNADGSVDALLNGELGLLVDPQSAAAVKDAIEKVLANPEEFTPNWETLDANFGYDAYKQRIKEMFLRLSA
jgi:glycosyltransferase involved in cell wall biosynthesis